MSPRDKKKPPGKNTLKKPLKKKEQETTTRKLQEAMQGWLVRDKKEHFEALGSKKKPGLTLKNTKKNSPSKNIEEEEKPAKKSKNFEESDSERQEIEEILTLTRTKPSDKIKNKTKIVKNVKTVKTTRHLEFKFDLDDHSSLLDSCLSNHGEDREHVPVGPHDVRGDDSAGHDEGPLQPRLVSEFVADLQLTSPLDTKHLRSAYLQVRNSKPNIYFSTVSTESGPMGEAEQQHS